MSGTFRLRSKLNIDKLHGQHFLHPLEVVLLDECEVIKISLAFLGLLGEDVAVVSVLPLDFSCSGKRETLFGTGDGLKLCHCFVN